MGKFLKWPFKMEKFLKKFYLGIYPLLIVLFMLILDKVIKLKTDWLQIMIAIGLAYALSPRKRIIQTETGEEKQLTWIFLKKPIILD